MASAPSTWEKEKQPHTSEKDALEEWLSHRTDSPQLQQLYERLLSDIQASKQQLHPSCFEWFRAAQQRNDIDVIRLVLFLSLEWVPEFREEMSRSTRDSRWRVSALQKFVSVEANRLIFCATEWCSTSKKSSVETIQYKTIRHFVWEVEKRLWMRWDPGGQHKAYFSSLPEESPLHRT